MSRSKDEICHRYGQNAPAYWYARGHDDATHYQKESISRAGFKDKKLLALYDEGWSDAEESKAVSLWSIIPCSDHWRRSQGKKRWACPDCGWKRG